MTSYELWVKSRREFIGSSESGELLNISPYGDQLSLWAKKTGRLQPTEDDNTGRLEAGRRAEGMIVDWFNDLGTGYQVELAKPYTTIRHKEYKFIGDTPDGKVIGTSTPVEAPVEVKTVSPWNVNQWLDGIPLYIKVQCQHHILVNEASYCLLIWMIGWSKPRYQIIERHENMCSVLEKACVSFWGTHVLPDKEPAPGEGKHSATILQKLYKPVEESVIELPDHYVNNWRRIKEITAQTKELTEEKTKLSNQVKFEMKENTKALMSNGLGFTWKGTKSRQLRLIGD